ncbi:hypothetical protein QFC20_005378 [Naganishia adeliensis]|uniref:Uncharacterized protein n=1 Tax=Naganishia adeliensis TaxID=92952 RepID=A0ACC2VPF2_9TREE|nr:hypothetical protein QFC20_005378 [Naganishia adeliensis]
MAVDYAPALASGFENLAVADESTVNEETGSGVRPSLRSLTIRLSADANIVPTAIAPESALSHTSTVARRQTFRVTVSVLGSKIAVVGLNKETERQWEHRVQVFLNYPEEQSRVVNNRHVDGSDLEDIQYGDISRDTEEQGLSTAPTKTGGFTKRPFISYIRTEDGTSLSTEIPIIRSLFQVDEREGLVQSGGELGIFDDDEDEDDEHEEPSRHRRDGTSDRGSSSFRSNRQIEGISPSSSCRSKNMFDSGYGSAFGPPPWGGLGGFDHAHQAGESFEDNNHSAACEHARRIDRKPERGVKRCLQLDFRRLKADGSEVEGLGDGGLDQTRLIARVSGRLQSRGLGLLYASTYHSANIMVESPYLHAAQKVLEEVIAELDDEARDVASERPCVL